MLIPEIEQLEKNIAKYCGCKYAISFRHAIRALSMFVFERSNCKKGDYYVCLVNPHLVKPYREYEKARW